MSLQPPSSFDTGDERPGTNRIQERVAHDIGTHAEVPADDEHVDDLVKPDAEERLDESPEEQQNLTDPDRDE